MKEGRTESNPCGITCALPGAACREPKTKTSARDSVLNRRCFQ